MQLQMETADLNECDFLETQFAEEGDEEGDRPHSDALMTGTMIYFMKGGRPHYEYEPIGCNRAETESWFSDAMARNQDHMWMKTIHWRLEKMSCVLVLRNKLWFQHAIRVLDDLWQTIVNERSNPQGCEHRAPKRRSPGIATAATAATTATTHSPISASASFMKAWLVQPERKCLIDVASLE